MARHTPGPWHRNIKPAKTYPTVFAGRNIHIAVIQSQGLTDEEIEGNCNLVSAAPQLLEALTFALFTIEHRDGLKYRKDLFTDDERATLRAAIAKATSD